MTESTREVGSHEVGRGTRNRSFELGRRLRHLRKQQGLTLAEAGALAGISASQLSMVENGKREPKVGALQALAGQFGVTLDELTAATPPNRRTRLEIELERYQRSPLARRRNLPSVRISPRLPMDALEALVALHRSAERDAEERTATPEAARRVNAELRQEMRRRDNYLGDIEREASALLATVGYVRGPLSEHLIGNLVAHLGFTLHQVADLPRSTRSVTDLLQRRIYLSRKPGLDHDPRSVLLQALGHHVLGHDTALNFKDFLRQRVESNYFAAALLMPESVCVDQLRRAHSDRDLAVEDLRDSFSVSHEMAAHRMTNLLTHHFAIPVHFMKVHENGVIYKAYENDDVRFPSDHTGAIEGQSLCRFWTSRQVFEIADVINPYASYTDTPTGTFWCTSRIATEASGAFSTTLGVPYKHVKWFRGRDTRNRSTSRCPDPTCCRSASPEVMQRWKGQFMPSAKAHSHLLATIPPGSLPGVDDAEVYAFLESHRV